MVLVPIDVVPQVLCLAESKLIFLCVGSQPSSVKFTQYLPEMVEMVLPSGRVDDIIKVSSCELVVGVEGDVH